MYLVMMLLVMMMFSYDAVPFEANSPMLPDIQRGNDTDAQGEGCQVTTEAEGEAVRLQTKKCQNCQQH